MSDLERLQHASANVPKLVPVRYYPTNARPCTVYVEPNLDQLQALVGGLIEIAEYRADGTIVVVNEEGLLLRMPRNPHAGMECYVGPAVVMMREDFK